ncbi:fibroblast growth factor receptor 4-like [Saccostrea echinata]|uniref:fibroblast growth factor receptor 4-like n=1 Tax=Saccostrea echinata TaxID=191078 RepID=UPI002A83B621|nr:fibroblast growth factor receptor 4-like [Saccostrea echinata]
MFHEKLRHKTKARNGYLRLKVLQKSDTGNYTCLVQNSEGSLNFTFRLNVVEISLLVLVDNPRRVTVLEGDRVVLRCMALGDSDANIHWEKMDDSIVDPETHSRDFLPCNDPEIVFEKVQVSDAGKYTCTIEYSTTYSIEVKSAVFLLTVNKDRIVTKTKPAVSMITPKPIFTDPKMNGLDDEEFFGSGVDENYDDGILRPRVINTLSNFNYSEEKDQFLLNNNNSIQDSPAGKPPHTDEEGLMKARTIDVILGVVAGVALLVGLVAIVAILYRYRLRSLTVTE